MNKIMMALTIMMLTSLIIPITFAQTTNDDILVSLRRLNNASEALCENAIKSYRAEAINEIDRKSDQIEDRVISVFRNQKGIFLIGTATAAFFGIAAAFLVLELTNLRKTDRIIGEVGDVIDKMHETMDNIQIDLNKKKPKKVKKANKKKGGK